MSIPDHLLQARLCYVDEHHKCYFTTQFETQWGDDWDDSPYEHNSEPPYYYDSRVDSAKVPWDIITVYLDGNWETPADRANGNSRYSVDDINKGAIAWLTTAHWGNDNARPIPAGITLMEFIVRVKDGGGTVYAPVEMT